MSAEPARAYLGIGDVIAQLRAEFPDVSVSKIRFLESEGLIQPARSPSGYRKFAIADVERLRYILTVQRDQYLPLRVIKDHLDAGEELDAAPPQRAPTQRAPTQRAPTRQALTRRALTRQALTRRELLAETGIGEAQLTELETFGLVRRTGRQYPPGTVAAIQAIAALAAYGVQARHLRVVRAAAERETELIEQVVAPILRQRSPGARERAGSAAREIASLALRVHAALVEMTLADAGFGEQGPGTSDR
jgi:DNA-binding transcriptional MerR regulator